MPKGIYRRKEKTLIRLKLRMKKLGLSNKGKILSSETKRRIAIAHIGKKHWNWKGGKSKLRISIANNFKYRQWRSDVFTRDNFTCVLCGLRGVYLEADHYPKLFSDIIKEYNIKTIEEALNCEELWSINNGRTLCKKCHYNETWNKN